MATTVYTTMEVMLDDDTIIVLKPLVIARMRKFMEIIDNLHTSEDVYEMQDRLVDAALICIEKHNPKVAANKEYFTENVDMETLYKILEVCGGVKLNDPNLTETLAEMVPASEENPGQP